MNKKLLTLAIGVALGAAPMFANAAATVYGGAHMSIDNLDNGNTTNSDVLTLSSNSSFIGFKAEEDLGSGMKAIFGAEWQIGLDTGTSNLGAATANRNVFAGLQTDFGTIKLGQIDDVVKKVGRSVDLFYNEQLGESRAATRQNFGGADWEARLANGVNYDSPSFGGVVITVNYGMENTVVDTGKLHNLAVGAQYASGPIYAGVAYKNSELTATTDTTAIRAAASYAFPFGLKLAGFYQTVSDVGGASGVDQDTYGVGASYTIGKIVPKVQYYNVDASNTAGTNGFALTAVGVDYLFSKTTVVYATYAKMANDIAANQTVVGAGHANPTDTNFGTIANGNDVTGISAGMRMSF